MDYFYVGNHLNTVGLNDVYFKAKYKVEKWWVAMDLHQFMANADILDTKILASQGKYDAMSSTLGTELDLTLGVIPAKGVSIQLGYSQMFATESMKVIKGGIESETNNWMYIMLTFKPILFKN